MTENKGNLISREALKKAILEHRYDYIEDNFFWSKLFDIIDNAPTVEPEITNEDIKNAIKAGYENGYSMAQAKYQRPQGEWIDYSNTFYKCPECGYLLDKYCPNCQNKVILPKGGAE